jgi:C-terminal processing protease CtpA/Prc
MLNHNAGLGLLLGFVLAGTALAQDREAPPAAESARAAEAAQAAASAQAAARAEAAEAYEKALKAAEVEQRAALQAVESARREIQQQAARQLEMAEQQKAMTEEQRAEAADQASQQQEAVRRELEHAYDSMRRATREVAQVHRELNRARVVRAPQASYAFRFGGDRPVIGVVLGESDDQGVHLLGVSPDGPAERAGLEQGDIIVSVMGEPLVADDSDARVVLGEVMEDIEVGDELVIAVDRDGELHEYTVTAEKREPFTWHSYTRLPSAPHSPSAPVVVENIVVPEIDREALEGKLARIREQVDKTRIVIDTEGSYSMVDVEGPEGYFFEIEEFSEFGDAVLAETNVWFGMPMTQGLKMAELDEGLGAYFKAESGVLVLKAKDDNALQLQSGDVILSVGGTEVAKPSDVMRALRGVHSGDEVEIDIMRDRKSRTLNVEVPERSQVGYMAFPEGTFDFQWAPENDWELHVEAHEQD